MRIRTAASGLVILALAWAPASAQTPEWRRACNPPQYRISAPESGGRGQLPSAGPSLTELAGLDSTVTSNADLARCESLANNLAAAISHVTRALTLLRSERAAEIPAEPNRTTGASRLVAGRDVPQPARTRGAPAVSPRDIAEIGIEGLVFVDAVVDREGRVRDPRIAGSIPALDRAALDAVRQWRYAPTLLNGAPVEVAIALIVPFGPDAGTRAIDALDTGRFFYGRRQYHDADTWFTRALESLQAEQADWAAVAPRTGRGAASAPKGQLVPPSKIRDVPPVYPAIAKAARFQGRSLIEAIIGSDGSIKRARVLKSEPMLAAAALAAVRQWKYSPTLLDGTPTEVLMTVVVTFALDSGPTR